jgi:methyl-accepting chemotaxis protein
MLNNIKIGPKLIGAFLFVALIACVIGFTGLHFLTQAGLAQGDMATNHLPSVQNLLTIAEAQTALIVGERGLLERRMFADRQVREAQHVYIDDAWKRAEDAWKAYEPLEHEPHEVEAWKEFTSSWEEWKAAYMDVHHLAEEKARLLDAGVPADDERVAAVDQKMFEASMDSRGHFLASQKFLMATVDTAIATAAATDRAADASQAMAQKILTITMILGALVAVAFGYMLSRSITAPLGKGVAMMQELAKGHLGLRLKMNRKDEIGVLAQTMDVFAEDLQTNVVGTMQKISAGDLSVDPVPKDGQDEIGPALKKTVESLRGLVAEAGMLSKAAVEGRLGTRGDADKFQGGYHQIVQGVNDTLDAVIGPLNVAANYVDRISKGDIPAKITDAYNGDFNTIKTNLNVCIDAVKLMIEDANMLSKAAVEGQLATRADATKHQGDFRRIIEGVNTTLDAVIGPLNVVAEVMEKVANRDLSARMTGNYVGDFAKIRDSVNQAAENLDQGLQQVAVAVEQVATAAAQIGTGSQALAQGASEQASSLEEVSSSLQEMASMTRQNTGNAKEARSLAEGARGSANKGLESMNRLSEAMEKIKSSSDATAKIVKTIDEIAFQTNLLALNAAVEAARAGDAGKGFAVVAEEVRNLAMRSAEAAKNTANMIEESVRNAESGVELNGEVLTKLQDINGQANKVGEVMAEIATASEQQTQGIDQVTTAVEQMNQLTQQNAANSEESASAAEELSGQGEELRALVNGFKLSVRVGAQGAGGGQARHAVPGAHAVHAVHALHAAPAAPKAQKAQSAQARAAGPAAGKPKLQAVGGGGAGTGTPDPESVIPFHDDRDRAVMGEF